MAACGLRIFVTQNVFGSLSDFSHGSTNAKIMMAEQENNSQKTVNNAVPISSY